MIEKDSRIAFARLVRELNLSEEPPDSPRPNRRLDTEADEMPVRQRNNAR